MSKLERPWQFAAVHEKKRWRKASHSTREAAISGPDGAENLLRGQKRVGKKSRDEEYGPAIAVFVWNKNTIDEFTATATAMRLVPGSAGEVERVWVPISLLKGFKKNGPSLAQIDEWFGTSGRQTDDPFDAAPEPETEAEFIEWLNNAPLSDTEKDVLVKVRVGQGYFRDALIKRWKGCAVSNCRNESLLIASHIKPWSKCVNRSERLSPDNGILLSPTLDTAFDVGLISFNDEFKILLHPDLDLQSRNALHILETMHLTQRHEGMKIFLKWHRRFHGFEPPEK